VLVRVLPRRESRFYPPAVPLSSRWPVITGPHKATKRTRNPKRRLEDANVFSIVAVIAALSTPTTS
jgi:hypothetical protein